MAMRVLTVLFNGGSFRKYFRVYLLGPKEWSFLTLNVGWLLPYVVAVLPLGLCRFAVYVGI